MIVLALPLSPHFSIPINALHISRGRITRSDARGRRIKLPAGDPVRDRTMGVPRTTTLKILKTPYNVTTDSVKVLAERWRYTPAVARGCKVAQLVQTPLRWR